MNFGTCVIPYCYEVVEELGVPYMLGCRFMEITAAITDHGLNRIYVRYKALDFVHDVHGNRKAEPEGDAMPKCIIGYPVDGHIPEPVELCPIYYTQEEALYKSSMYDDEKFPSGAKQQVPNQDEHECKTVSMVTYLRFKI